MFPFLISYKSGSKFTASARGGKLLLCLCAVSVAGGLLLNGCANQPPSKASQSGVRLRIRLNYAAPVNRNEKYFFLLNNVDDSTAPGSVPVSAPLPNNTYGNGFATASDAGASGKPGFTDFVLFGFNDYENASVGGYSLFHVVNRATGREDNRINFRYVDTPLLSTLPSNDQSQPDANTLIFEIDMAQLERDVNGNLLTDAINRARQRRYVQVNIVSTNLTPTDTTAVGKIFDSLGDNRQGDGRGSFLRLDLTQTGVITSSDERFVEVTEPSNTSDTVGGNDPQIDLRSWSIEVVRTN